MPFKSEKQRKWMYANEPEMAKKWEKEEAIRGKLRNLIKQEIKSINEGFDKYYLSSLLDSRLKKKLEIAIKNLKGKVDSVGTDYIWFRMPSHNLDLLSQLITKLDRNKNVWIGDKRKNNIWDRRQKINKLEATTTVSVPGYLSPNAFSKSTQNAIDVDDEDDEKNESDLGLTYKKGKTIKVTHEKSGKELIIIDKPNVRREYQKIGYFAEGKVNELQMAPFSSSEARQHINQDIKKMSKELGKTSHDIIKMMMDGVKRGRYTAMDISRGIKEGPAKRTHFGELQFIQQLWNKVRDKFRRYSKDGKLR